MSGILSEFVEVVVFRRAGSSVMFLLLKRAATESPYPGIWQVVSGRRRENERGVDAALREIREETGVDPIGMWNLPYVNTFYMPDGDTVHAVPAFAAEIPSGASVRLSSEHSEFRWLSREDAEHLVQWPAHLSMMDLVKDYVLQERGSVHRIHIS